MPSGGRLDGPMMPTLESRLDGPELRRPLELLRPPLARARW